MKPTDLWHAILTDAGLTPDPDVVPNLARYQDWLATEGVAGGGISPGDKDRLGERHIADSLLFAGFLDHSGPVLDVGSGVGLPGIPLAISRPDLEFVCLDRSGRRVDLASRAIRILGLDNVTARQGSVESVRESYPRVVSRAAIPAERMRPLLDPILEPGGVAILGGSWVEAPQVTGYATIEIGQKILSKPVWILMMTAT